MKVLLVILLFLSSLPSVALDIVVPERKDQLGRHVRTLLSEIANSGSITLKVIPVSPKFNTQKWRSDVLTGSFDLMYTVDNEALYDDYLPIKVPLLGGLFGERGCLIRKQDKDLFDTVRELSDIQYICNKFDCVSGLGWGDTAKLSKALKIKAVKGGSVMEAGIINGAVKEYQQNGVFHDYDGESYTCYFRGLGELSEVVKHTWVLMTESMGGSKDYDPRREVTATTTFGIRYSNPLYLWVKKDNQVLHDILYRELTVMLDNGYIDKLVNELPMKVTRDAIANKPGFVFFDIGG